MGQANGPREAGLTPVGKKKGLGFAPARSPYGAVRGFHGVGRQVRIALEGLSPGCARHTRSSLRGAMGWHTIPSYTLFCFSPFFFLFYNPASCPCSSQGIEVHHSSAALNFAHQTFRALPSTATSQTSSAILQFVGFSSLHYSWAARDKAMCDVAKTCLQV